MSRALREDDHLSPQGRGETVRYLPAAHLLLPAERLADSHARQRRDSQRLLLDRSRGVGALFLRAGTPTPHLQAQEQAPVPAAPARPGPVHGLRVPGRVRLRGEAPAPPARARPRPPRAAARLQGSAQGLQGHVRGGEQEDGAHALPEAQAAPRKPAQGLRGGGPVQEQGDGPPPPSAAGVPEPAAVRDAGRHQHLRAVQAGGGRDRSAAEGGQPDHQPGGVHGADRVQHDAARRVLGRGGQPQDHHPEGGPVRGPRRRVCEHRLLQQRRTPAPGPGGTPAPLPGPGRVTVLQTEVYAT